MAHIFTIRSQSNNNMLQNTYTMTANCRCVKYYATLKSTATHTAHTKTCYIIFLCRDTCFILILRCATLRCFLYPSPAYASLFTLYLYYAMLLPILFSYKILLNTFSPYDALLGILFYYAALLKIIFNYVAILTLFLYFIKYFYILHWRS